VAEKHLESLKEEIKYETEGRKLATLLALAIGGGSILTNRPGMTGLPLPTALVIQNHLADVPRTAGLPVGTCSINQHWWTSHPWHPAPGVLQFTRPFSASVVVPSVVESVFANTSMHREFRYR
jgi:hypothetical protein